MNSRLLKDESWKCVFETLAFAPDHPNWSLIVKYLTDRANRPKSNPGAWEMHIRTTPEIQEVHDTLVECLAEYHANLA
jgi:hypothetical protein